MASSRRFCTNCGQQVFENSKFCGSCGSSLADDGPPPVASPQAQMAPPPYAPPPIYSPPPAYAARPPQQPMYQPQPPPAYQPPPIYQPPQPGYQTPQAYPPSGYQQPAAYGVPPQPYGYSPQPGNQTGETLTGIIPGASRKKSLISVEGFNIIVTNQRMIFALMTTQMVQEEAKRKAAGKGFFGGMAAGMGAGFDLWKRYLDMPPEQALRENPGNFDIPLNQIRRIKFDGGKTLFKKGGISIGMNINRDDDEPAKLEIETVGIKYKFDIATHFQGEARDVLKRAGLIN